MTVGNFQEIIGTDGFDSISGSDLTVVYGLQGDDVLNSIPTFAGGVLPDGGDTSILVGGTGDNAYQIRNHSTSIVIENNNSNDNILWTTIGSNNPGLSLSGETSFVAEIDNRHLYLGDTTSDQYVILLDWQVMENQIESFDLVEGRISYENVASSFRDADGYRGNFAWDKLTDEIDFERLGLNPDSIDDVFDEIRERSVELENTNNAPQTVELFRFRNSSYPTGTYIFVNETEKNNIENSESLSQSFVVKGVTETGEINPAFTASLEPGDNLLPFFRLSSLVNPGTFLFVSTEEYNTIFADNSGQRTQWEPQGFDNLGLDIPEFYLYGVDAPEGRDFNRFQNIDNGTFLYADEDETTTIINNPNFSSVFVNQGVAFKSLL